MLRKKLILKKPKKKLTFSYGICPRCSKNITTKFERDFIKNDGMCVTCSKLYLDF